MTPPAPLEPHPDRLLPADAHVRAIARRLYGAVRDLPIVSPHGHRPTPRGRPVRRPGHAVGDPDHYVTRLLHASGVGLDALGVGQGRLDEATAREVWRQLCTHWEVYRGTPVRYWLESELADIFGVSVRPSAQTADDIYDQIADRLAQEAYRPRAPCERFGIATTRHPTHHERP